MDDKLYYRELACYEDAEENVLRMIGKMDFYDLSLLPGETMREEFRRYLYSRGRQVTLRTIQQEKAYFKQFCAALQTKRTPDSLLEWEESEWIRLLKGWMMLNGVAITEKKMSIYQTVHIVEAHQLRYLRRVIRFLQPEDQREEKEKDIWHLDRLDVIMEANPIYNQRTLNFTKIAQKGIREEVKAAIYQHLKYEKLGTINGELSTMRRFSTYLSSKYSEIESCADIDRAVLEEYLVHKATDGGSGRGNSTHIQQLRSVLETIGKLHGYEHLERLFLNTDIPSEIQPEFKAYSDAELKRLNAQITKLDVQITRCLVIHQMLGTRISDTLTLRKDCLFRQNSIDMITIQQVKTRTYQKPISAELAALIQKAIQCTEKRYGKTEYIFVDEKDTNRPLQYSTIKHKVIGLITKMDLRDDDGKPFTFSTHMFRRAYGVKLTELHLDDWTIAKLLGHKNVRAVQYYRKMSHQLLADETRRAREIQTRILLENLQGWGDEYEQIR